MVTWYVCSGTGLPLGFLLGQALWQVVSFHWLSNNAAAQTFILTLPSVTQKKSTASFQYADLGTLTRLYQWLLSVEVDGEEHTLHWYLSWNFGV